MFMKLKKQLNDQEDGYRIASILYQAWDGNKICLYIGTLIAMKYQPCGKLRNYEKKLFLNLPFYQLFSLLLFHLNFFTGYFEFFEII